jgi:hypothetical protein
MKLDAQKTQAIVQALSVLPENHPARTAFHRGSDVIALAQLLEHDELAQSLADLWFAAYQRRVIEQRGGE